MSHHQKHHHYAFSESRDVREDRGIRQMKTHLCQTFPHSHIEVHPSQGIGSTIVGNIIGKAKSLVGSHVAKAKFIVRSIVGKAKKSGLVSGTTLSQKKAISPSRQQSPVTKKTVAKKATQGGKTARKKNVSQSKVANKSKKARGKQKR